MPEPPMPEPCLLTPGPLTTSRTVKEAMLRDWGSRDGAFIDLNTRIRARLVELAGGEGTHVAVPVQGSGTFAVEAMVGTLLPPGGRLLVLVNGAYGKRMVRMAEVMGHSVAALEAAEDQPVDVGALDRALSSAPTRTFRTSPSCTARPPPASSTPSGTWRRQWRGTGAGCWSMP